MVFYFDSQIKILKKELEDYEEDLKDLKSAKEETQRHSLSETKGAKRLFSRVMIKIFVSPSPFYHYLIVGEQNAQSSQLSS